MKITGGLRTAVEYSLQACDHDTSPGRAHIGFFDSLNIIVIWHQCWINESHAKEYVSALSFGASGNDNMSCALSVDTFHTAIS